MSLFEEIQEIICEQLRVNPEEVKLETSFIDDLGTGFLASIELIMELEERFEIEIPDEDGEEMDTVGDVVDYIEKKINRHG